jgi:6,7-dimethyl-8-ribityllumazine synthase
MAPNPDGRGLRLGIVASRFNEEFCTALVNRARAEATRLGVAELRIESVPGALEIPSALRWMADRGEFDALVALGVVIRGETYHFEIVAGESARGIMALTMDGLAIGNGILTVENEAQALVRADPAQKDKGGEAAKAALALLALKERFGG